MYFAVEMSGRARDVSATGTAEVVEVATYHGGDHVSHCPRLRWIEDGESIQAESNYCTRRPDEFTVGQELAIRYDPDEPDRVWPDTFWAIYGSTFPIAVAGIVLSILGVAAVVRRRRHT